MREVVVETKGKGTRTITVGREKKVKRPEPIVLVGLICSPPTGTMSRGKLSSIFDPVDIKPRRCWKITKRGFSHARKNWQRHGERPPSRRRHRWGRVRSWMYPSVRVLNEKGLCIYPEMSC